MITETKARKLTDDEVSKVNQETKDLALTAAKQCREQVETLSREIARDVNLGGPEREHLINILENNGLSVALCQVSDANVNKQLQVLVTYNIDDDLYAYLRRPAEILPSRLRGFLEGGTE